MARVGDVQSTDTGPGFVVWDDDKKLTLSISFASDHEAEEACRQFRDILNRAVSVKRSPSK